jgi:hypothetical protein
MKRWVLFVALLLGAVPAAAQPPRFGDVAQALYTKAHLTPASSDDEKRVVTIQLAEQLAFEFPGQGWGAKTAGAGRPISKDCVAKVESLTGGTSIVKGVCYDWILGGGGVKLPPQVNDITGQVFVPVAAVDHLGAAPAPPPPPPPASDLESRLAALEQRVAKLEDSVSLQTPPVVTSPAPPATSDLAALAADVKRIREMLELALKRFSLQ